MPLRLFCGRTDRFIRKRLLFLVANADSDPAVSGSGPIALAFPPGRLRQGVLGGIAGAGGRQLESGHAEGAFVVVRVIDQHAVVNGFLNTFCVVRIGRQSAELSRGLALLQPDRLRERVVRQSYVVDDHTPATLGVDGAQWSRVFDLGRADVIFLFIFVDLVHGIIRIDVSVLVKVAHQVVVSDKSFLQFIPGEGITIVL